MNKKLVENLSNIPAISGFEKVLRTFLQEELSQYSVSFRYDNLGSLIATIDSNKPGPTIAVAAHMDEVGFMVQKVNERGFITGINVGGVVPESVISTQVVLHTQTKDMPGVILGIPPHLNEGKKITIEDLVFDFGFSSKEEALKVVRPGDMITFKNNYVELNNDLIVGKAMDDRLGIAALVELANEFKQLDCGKLLLCATVQEEVGLRGAETVLYAIEEKIDNIIVIDVSPVNDTLDVTSGALGEGCLIRVKDPRMIFDREETILVETIAQNQKINYQHYFSKGGTDGAMLQLQKDGFKVIAICIPARNIHTANCVVDTKDYDSAVDLATSYIKYKQKEFYEKN